MGGSNVAKWFKAYTLDGENLGLSLATANIFLYFSSIVIKIWRFQFRSYSHFKVGRCNNIYLFFGQSQ